MSTARTKTKHQTLALTLTFRQAESLLGILETAGQMINSDVFSVRKRLRDFVEKHGNVLSSVDSDAVMDNASNPHTIVYGVYRKAFPASRIHQGAVIDLPGQHFEIDILDETEKIAVEIHGAQHYQKNHFFHKGQPDGLMKQRRRDRKKRAWCDEKGFRYVEIPYQVVDKLTIDLLKQMVYDSDVDAP